MGRGMGMGIGIGIGIGMGDSVPENHTMPQFTRRPPMNDEFVWFLENDLFCS